MKKSQIMAVFALALALGAVAPIAGVVGGASAVTEPELDATGAVIPGKEGKATVKDMDDYQQAVEDSAQYKALDKLAELVADFTADGLTGAEVETGTVTTAGSLANAINTVYIAGIKATGAKALTNENLTEALAIVKSNDNVKNYTAWAATYDLIAQVAAGDVAQNTAKETLKGYYKTLNNGTAYAGADTYAGITGAIATLDAGNGYKDLYDAIKKAELVLDYKEQITGVFEEVKAAGIATSGLSTADTWAKLAKNTGSVYASVKGTDAYKAYVKLEAKFTAGDGISDGHNDNEAGQKTNYNELAATTGANALLQWVADLWNMDVDDLTPTKVIGHKSTTPSTDPGTTDTPAGDEDNTDADVNAPNTGILSSAEGSATTISIVAGLTTALASLGAGVVAYRSARRGE